jgi:carbon-monoxide dehydrogenase medium subunit
MQQVAPGIAYRAIRNRGTLGGSLAHADPAADWVLTVVGLGATLEIAGPDGVRMLPAEDYMQGAYTTGLREDELIAAVHIPEAGPQARWGYYKFCRKTGEFAEASCAAWFDPSSKTARIAVGALDGAPRLLPQLAARIAQQGLAGLDEALLASELAGVMQDKDEHHRKLHGTAVTRCLAQALG